MLFGHLSRDLNNSVSRKAQGVASARATWPHGHQAGWWSSGLVSCIRQKLGARGRHGSSTGMKALPLNFLTQHRDPHQGPQKAPVTLRAPDMKVQRGNNLRKSPSLGYSEKNDAVCPEAPSPLCSSWWHPLWQRRCHICTQQTDTPPILASYNTQVIGSFQASFVPLSANHGLLLQSTCFSFFFSYS